MDTATQGSRDSGAPWPGGDREAGCDNSRCEAGSEAQAEELTLQPYQQELINRLARVSRQSARDGHRRMLMASRAYGVGAIFAALRRLEAERRAQVQEVDPPKASAPRVIWLSTPNHTRNTFLDEWRRGCHDEMDGYMTPLNVVVIDEVGPPVAPPPPRPPRFAVLSCLKRPAAAS